MVNDQQTWPDIEKRIQSLEWPYRQYSKGFLVSCPNKEWHKQGDAHFSCAVWPNVDWFRCYGCGREGRLPALFEGTGQELSRFWSMRVKREREVPENIILDEDILDSFRPATLEDLKRLNSDRPNRQWGSEHISRFDLRYDERHSNLVFPVRSPELVGAVGRNIHKKMVHNYFGFFTGRSLGGLDLIEPGRPNIVVEGWTCLVNCWAWANQQGYNVVCTFTANITKYQAEMLGDLMSPVIFMFDEDPAGRKGVKKYEELSDSNFFSRSWPESWGDVGDMSESIFLRVLG